MKDFCEEPIKNVKVVGYNVLKDSILSENALDDFNDDLKKVWEKLISQKDFTPFIILSAKSTIANYIFYTTSNRVKLNEYGKTIILKDKDVYLSAGRTIPCYLGHGLSEYSKRYLFYMLYNNGYEKAHLLAKASNKISNHVNRKLDIPMTKRIYVIKILKKKYLINRNMKMKNNRIITMLSAL